MTEPTHHQITNQPTLHTAHPRAWTAPLAATMPVLLCLVLLITGCAPQKEAMPNQRNYYAEGYKGPVVVLYEREGFPPIPTVSEEDATQLLEFDSQGLLITSSQRPESARYANLVSHFWKSDSGDTTLLQANPDDPMALASPQEDGLIVDSTGITTINGNCTYAVHVIYPMYDPERSETKKAQRQAADELAKAQCAQTTQVIEKDQ